MRSGITHVAVVIPARNESETLQACLTAIREAEVTLRDDHPVRVSTVVVLDTCSDDSTAIAAEFPWVTAIHAWYSNVGDSRAAGVRWALESLRSPAETTWIANTDADSTVPTNWLLEHVRFADAGADVLLGSVEPNRADLTTEQQRAWDASHPLGRAIGHVHGANLGVRASEYARAGGFASQLEHEDVDLVGRLHSVGARVATGDSFAVVTSGRTTGRTPSGYAGYLRTLERTAHVSA